MPRTRSRSSTRALAEASLRLVQQGAGGGRVGFDQPPGGVERQPHRDQPGLRAVVQVPLDPAQLGRPGVQGLAPRPGEMSHPPLKLGLRRRREYPAGQAGVAAQQRRGEPGTGDDHGKADDEQDQRRVAREGGRRHEVLQAVEPAQAAERGDDEGDDARAEQQQRHEQDQQARDGVHREPEQVPPGRPVIQQPAHPLPVAGSAHAQPPAWAVFPRRGRVRLADGYPAPPCAQPPGVPGEPTAGEQGHGQHQPAAGRPDQHAEQVGSVLAPRGQAAPERVLDQVPETEPGDHHRGDGDDEEYRPREQQAGERQRARQRQQAAADPPLRRVAQSTPSVPMVAPGRVRRLSSLPPAARSRSVASTRSGAVYLGLPAEAVQPYIAVTPRFLTW